MKPTPDALAPVDVAPIFEGVPIVNAAELSAHKLDVVLNLGGGEGDLNLSGSARLGVLSLHHGESPAICANTPLFSEFQQRCSIVRTTVHQCTKSEPAARVICETSSATDRVSLARSQNQTLWKSAALLARALRELRSGVASAPPDSAPHRVRSEAVKTDRSVSNAAMLPFLVRTGARIIRNQLEHHLFDVEWSLALRRGAIDDGGTWELIRAPRGRFYADPFMVREGDQHHVFFEDCPVGRIRGVISWFSIDREGRRSAAQCVLERPYHLSYPCVFKWRGDYYMIPETGRNRTVELYRAARFPDRWELDRVLMSNVTAVDATAVFHEGRFWLMMAMSEMGGSVNDELFLFHAESPHGRLVAHPANPVVSDVRFARPAGTPHHSNGRLIRPGQDSSEGYGRAINLRAIEVWNTREYRECPAGRIEPSAITGGIGTHTINMAGDWTVSDAWRHRFKFA